MVRTYVRKTFFSKEALFGCTSDKSIKIQWDFLDAGPTVGSCPPLWRTGKRGQWTDFYVTFQERWFQEIAESAKLSPLSPEVINTLLPIVELHIRKIIQNAHKHQRHSKCSSLKGNTYCFCLLQESSMFRS
jgi:hypothetical protein